MRADSLVFSEKNKSENQEPVYAVEISFDLANTDTHFITTHTVSGLSGSISNRALKVLSSSTQKLDPEKAHALIGNIRFEALDAGITDILRTKLNENKGLKGKRVVVYKGHKGLLWSQFTRFNTYVIDNSIGNKNGAYTFNCGDIQRSMKKKIFIERTTSLMAPLSETATELEVFDASKFELVYQVPSASGVTLLRGLQQRVHPPGHENAGQLVYPQLAGIDYIGLVRIPGDDEDEIALFTGKSGNTLTGLIRGVLGTKAASVEVESGISLDDAPKISEFVYINMPAVKAVYALLTGSIYGAPGEFLPDHWHLGISTDYIQTSSFVNIGSDLWDLTDDDKGFPVLIKGRTDVEAKKLIEENIYYMLGLYGPINSEGEIYLKRMQYIGPNGSYVRLINESNVIDYSEVKHDLSAVKNTFIIRWNYDDIREKFTRTSALYDPISIERHGASDVKIIELDTLHGSRHSDASIKYHFDSLRSRYAGPPLKLDLTLTPNQDDLEVGDIVRVDLTAFEDFSNEAGTLNRNFEVQQVSIDTKTGRVKVNLFASSQRASDVVPEVTDTVLEDFLTSQGTEINATNFPSAGIVSSGGVTTVNGSLTLNGNFNLNDSSAIYYCNEDLTIDASAIITITNNVQLRVNGFLQHNGLINGKGNGLSGGVADSDVSHNFETPDSANIGKKGIGITTAQDGLANLALILRPLKCAGSITEGDNVFLPRPLLTFAGNSLNGMPSSLLGTSGSSGGGIGYRIGLSGESILALGGDGGDGGAGLAIFSIGASLGAAAEINLSGADGLPGEVFEMGTDVVFTGTPSPSNRYLAAGAGAGGAPGGLVLVTLDSSQAFFDKDPSKIKQEFGLCPKSEQIFRKSQVTTIQEVDLGIPASFEYYDVGFSNENEDTNTVDSNTHLVFLDVPASPEQDTPAYVEKDPSFTLTEKLNTPVTPDGDRSTIELSVTPPIFASGEVNNYSYSLVDYREQGSDVWLSALPASNESIIEVPTDGTSYEVRIRAVSTKRNANDTGPIKTITVTDINGRNDSELSAIYPFDAITGLALQGESDNTFAGRDISIEWDNSNSEYTYFNYYQVDIYSGAQLLRTEKSVSPFYVYTFEKNAVDYIKINSEQGFYPDIDVYVKPVSKYFNDVSELYSGTSATINVIAQALVPDAIDLSYAGSNAVLSWPESSQQFLTITATLEYAGTVLLETTGNNFVIPFDWIGSRTFSVSFSHLPGYSAPAISVVVNPNKPATPVVSARVISNSVTLNYTSAKGSLPIDRYEIRRGGTYDAGQTPEIKAGTSSFTVSEEISAGTVVFWFEAVDTAGNRSDAISVSAIVSQPQNYQLLAQYSAKADSWPGTLTNCLVTESNSLLLPVNTTETWTEHFTNNSFDTPQDQIDAGYEYYLQPSTNTAQYQFTYDYLSLIDSATVTANSAPIILDGSVTVAVEIEYSDDNSTWTSGGAGQTQIIATDFRYIRVTLDFTSVGGDDLAYVEDVLVSIDKRVDDDSGKFSAVSTDATGTRVYFNKDFIDAQTPTVSVSSTEIVDVVVDFNDVPDPEYFDVYVFSRSTGLRINASGSWTVRGFTRIGT